MFWNPLAGSRIDDGIPSSSSPARPRGRKVKLGIAFGSGAARGWAHIGVIRRLAEAGIVPDVISGTSIGALVGGCHAAGKLDELEEFARTLTRRRLFGLLDITWSGSGIIGGNRLTDLLVRELGSTRIEDLATPFTCIATELSTGHELWLNKGRLVDALRASYALPGVFKPVQIDGRWLIDGAVVNPIPVSACRALGARMVIAVNLNTDDLGGGTVIQSPGAPHVQLARTEGEEGVEPSGVPSSIFQAFRSDHPDQPSVTAVLVAAFNISQDRLARSRLAGDPPDLVISPRAADIGLFDFDRAADSIALGYRAVDYALPYLERVVDAYAASEPDA